MKREHVLDRTNQLRVRPTEGFALRSLLGLTAVIVAGAGFSALLGLVLASWAPLIAFDVVIAGQLNELVSGEPLVVNVLQVLTEFGGSATSWLLLTSATLWLLIRRLPRLALFVAVTGLGAAILTPTVKMLVERIRPLVDMPIVPGSGFSFPSGHALGSMVVYGVLILVFLPAVPRPWHKGVCIATVALVVAIGLTRIALGVHFVSDVVAGWLLATVWLAVTTSAFRQWLKDEGRALAPLAEGLEPEAAPALAAVPDEPTGRSRNPWQLAAPLAVVWILLLGLLLQLGTIVAELAGNTAVPAFDRAVMEWISELRTPLGNTLAGFANAIGSTSFIVGSAVIVGPVTLAVTRRWRPLLYLAVVMLGEVTLFLITAEIINRNRPSVPILGPVPPPTASFPSGHMAATVCWYGAIAVLIAGRTSAPWRWVTVGLAVVASLVTASARVYSGAHFPTDILGSLLFALPWLTATSLVLRPNAEP
jgi:undecaprenyl-diphosphatase